MLKSCLRAGVIADFELPVGEASGAFSACSRTRRAAFADGRSAGETPQPVETEALAGLSIIARRGRPFWLCRDLLCSAELRDAGTETAEAVDAAETGWGSAQLRGAAG